MVDGEERALSGVVHGTIARGFGDANIFDGAIAIDGEGDGGFGATSGANAGVDGVLHPVLIDGATNGFDIPGVASGEIATTLALNRDAAVERAGSVGIAAQVVHGAALAVGDGVFGRRSFGFEDFGFFAGRKRLFLFEFGDLGGVGDRARAVWVWALRR